MRRRFIQAAALTAGAFAALSVTPIAQTPPTPSPLTVHEWGTFTSVAGPDGQAVRWLPQSGPTELPCFVERSSLPYKFAMPGTVRMETPVLYFYSPRAIDVSVRVAFPDGVLSEWYPHATVTANMAPGGTIAWPSVHVAPGDTAVWPREGGSSHYYTARETDAVPVRVGSQAERFLFYRGIGVFQPALTAIARDDGGAELRHVGGLPIGDVILFENRRGAMTFTTQHVTGDRAALARPDLDDASGAPLAELKQMLIAHGLFEKEAQAMVDTWKDSWFDEGSRLLYIVPRADVNEILPLTIEPAPAAVERVFVGRIELVTPATLLEVKTAIESSDKAVLMKYGRFLEPIAERAGLGTSRLVSSATVAAVNAAGLCR